ncbi:hypothetical protein D3C72_1632890 [compost metagenome]
MGTIRKTMAPASMLIIHSGWICWPALAASTMPWLPKTWPMLSISAEESTQSSMKFGSRSKSCMNISQKPEKITRKAASRGSKTFFTETTRIWAASCSGFLAVPESKEGRGGSLKNGRIRKLSATRAALA